MSEWKNRVDINPNQYEYGGYLITCVEKFIPHRFEMSCTASMVENGEKKKVTIDSTGDTFEEAKEDIIELIDVFNRRYAN